MYFQLIPYLAFTIFFSIYTIRDYQTFTYLYDGGSKAGPTLVRFLTFLTLTYRMFYEVIQIYFQRMSYFNIWNLFDLFEIFGIIIAEGISTYARNLYQDEGLTMEKIEEGFQLDRLGRLLFSLVALSVWTHFLYFFRIFRSTGYYIRMIVEVIRDIKEFIFIFGILVIAFGHAFNVFYRNGIDHLQSFESPHPRYYYSLIYSYRLALGDFNTDDFPEYQQWVPWLFFMLATLINLIVLLNLLISIVSDTFGRIKEQHSIYMYKDMLYLMIENKTLFKIRK